MQLCCGHMDKTYFLSHDMAHIIFIFNPIQETEISIKREYFNRWRQRLHTQQSHAEEVVVLLQQQQDDSRLRSMFNFWRRHFRATLVAR